MLALKTAAWTVVLGGIGLLLLLLYNAFEAKVARASEDGPVLVTGTLRTTLTCYVQPPSTFVVCPPGQEVTIEVTSMKKAKK